MNIGYTDLAYMKVKLKLTQLSMIYTWITFIHACCDISHNASLLIKIIICSKVPNTPKVTMGWRMKWKY